MAEGGLQSFGLDGSSWVPLVCRSEEELAGRRGRRKEERQRLGEAAGGGGWVGEGKEGGGGVEDEEQRCKEKFNEPLLNITASAAAWIGC